MKILFVRHGKDDERYRGGWSQLDLLPEGIAQAQKLAHALKARQSAEPITAIISSDLARAMSTARIIAEALGLPVAAEPQLRETNNGDLAGMLNEVARVQYPGLFFSSLGMDEPYPNGESPRAFYLRIKAWFEAFLATAAQQEGNLLVVTHGGVINVIYHLVNQLEWTNRSPAFKATYCSVHVLNPETMEMANLPIDE